MRRFVDAANDATPDEIWLLQHPPVYTLGRAGLRRHLLRANGIAVVRGDRGGQITYHAPGQIIAYILWNIRRRQMGLRALVRGLEGAVIAMLAERGIAARGDATAPGVYTADGGKIAALGLRVRRGWTYHGVSVNVRMDLSPFADINPCGYPGLKVTQISDYAPAVTVSDIAESLTHHLLRL